MIDFHLDEHSGVPPYLQIVQQVKQSLRLGMIGVGDRLPDGERGGGTAGH